jgi:neopullulanase
VEKLKMALTFVFTTRGIPMMYYGTELLMTGYEHHGHGLQRKRFPGGWPGDDLDAFSAKGRTYEQNQIVNHIRKLLELRHTQPALQYGWLKQFVPQENIYVYVRYDDESSIMIVINGNEEEKKLDSKRFTEATAGFHVGRDILTDFAYRIDDEWVVPAKTALVLELKSSFMPQILD